MMFNPVALAKRAFYGLLSEQQIGMVEYLRSPGRAAQFGPFNGQPARKALYEQVLAKTHPQAIIETGTYLGMTTELMAQTGLPIYAVEAHPRFYGFVRARFWRTKNVKAFHGDSRTALRRLFDGELKPLAKGTLFFYLDAHWHDDLPLAEEIDIIYKASPLAVLMIDDFQVPFDAGYGYDDYGPGKALTPDYIRPMELTHQLSAFYPSTPSANDGPSKRGCVVLAKAAHARELASIPLLRLADDTVQSLQQTQ
jgi:hypothetical protein